MKKVVLITGATGFIGANLLRRMQSREACVHIFMRRGADMWRIKDGMSGVVQHTVDMRSPLEIEKAVMRIRPHVVYHLASYGAYPFQADIDTMIQTDILGTLGLLNAATGIDRLEAFISAGSSTEYGFKQNPMREDDVLEPNTAYGAAKASQTLLAQFFAKTRGIPVVVIRPSLVYGSYEEPTRLIPDAIISHLRKRPLLLSSPAPKKDFVFIEDVLDAMDVMVKNSKKFSGHIFNIASGKEYAVGQVVSLIHELMDITIPYKWGKREGRIWDTSISWVDDVSKARKLLGWKPEHSFESGLTKTIAWFSKNHTLYP